MKYNPNNVLIVPDLHLPFEHRNALEFCIEIRERCHCGTIVFIGDIVDNHAISFHDHDPNGFSPEDEMKAVDKKLEKWFKTFPFASVCRGNHDRLVDRKARHVGLPDRAFKPFRDIWKLPAGWIDGFSFEINGVRYMHGTGYSGRNAHIQAAIDNRQSTVIGHIHSVSGVEYIANNKDTIFGMQVGCLIDKESYAFAYGRDFKLKPILSCGITTDKGKFCQVFPL